MGTGRIEVAFHRQFFRVNLERSGIGRPFQIPNVLEKTLRITLA